MTIELGGNIELVGFRELDSSKLIVVKKMVGNYARKMSEDTKNFEKLVVTLKQIGQPDAHKFELHGKLMDNGRPITSVAVDYNVFFALDKALSGIMQQMGRD
ncbi:hypothetical protein HY488_02470 [Candidatus Woesearchaeota archaeon]|nr:hypothetical protein [Candidatus Woesearchaeota archaeon]